MNLKRHHVLYAVLAACLMLAIIVFLMPRTPRMSYTAPTASTTPAAATTTKPIPASSKAPTAAPLRFEVVTTEAAQELGLGGRESISQNYGMLFVFPRHERVGFWMKDMLAPIDMIWLSDNGTILGIEDSVAPESYPKPFYPPQPVKYVLETKAGEARRQHWTIGTKIELPLPYQS